MARVKRPTTDLDAIVRLIGAGLRVLRERDAIKLSEALIVERSRNITQYLVSDYEMTPRDPKAAVLLSLGPRVLRLDPSGADSLGHVTAATVTLFEVPALRIELATAEAMKLVGALKRVGLDGDGTP